METPSRLDASGRSVGAAGLDEQLKAQRERTAADPGLIVVELTETALLADARTSDLFVERLRRVGRYLAPDDFARPTVVSPTSSDCPSASSRSTASSNGPRAALGAMSRQQRRTRRATARG